MIRYALSLIFRRKFRTFLTSLGITISVILLSFIIFGMQGLQNVITGEFSSRFKPNQLVVSTQDLSSFGIGEETESTDEKPTFITPEIVEKIKVDERVEKTVPLVNVLGFQIEYENKNVVKNAIGSGLISVADTSFYKEFTGDNPEPKDNEIFLGNSVLDKLNLNFEEIKNKTVILTPSSSTLLGQKSANLLNKEYKFIVKGYINAGIDRQDFVVSLNKASNIMAEIGSFKSSSEHLKNYGYDQLFIDLKDANKANEFKNFLKSEYNLNSITSADLQTFLSQITAVLTLALTLFALVAAVVASIGIVNTMVMSIYEQTKEIGIIKAIGASDLQVLTIFLIQAGMIGLIGSTIGLAIVLTTLYLSNPFIIKALEEQDITLDAFFTLDLKIIAIIVLGSIVVGLLAGIYPAIKAAKLNPVKALRYE